MNKTSRHNLLVADYVLCNCRKMDEQRKQNRFGAILREARERAGISLEAAANYIGISTASFSRMETGISSVTASRMAKLAEHYGVSVAGLFEGQLIRMPTNVDVERMKSVVILVHQVIGNLNVSPSPEKIADVVSQIYTDEIKRLLDDTKADLVFDPDSHRAFITMIFRT